MKIWVRKESDGFSPTGCVREFGSLKECFNTLAEETSIYEFCLRSRCAYEKWIPEDVADVVEICDGNE